ncbi:MAG: hypothetical protein HOL08_07950 [Opitutae bacterium]|jgi:hypothetical protein|nr:hypothetical protein [Opitutae bacterium]
MKLTKHAEIRLQQRGMKPSDIDLIMEHGASMRDGFFLRRQDVQNATSSLKKTIQRLEKLAGHAVIAKGESVLTAYIPDKYRERLFMEQGAKRF